ncbi:hypothetical protein EVAR_90355_1 [Eumeta japonica]|uniref:Uncharacterized protein n=1 Tax=Eumeta variegata TaxID=151549 RepID=A0A4C1YBC4_EUMVA|nr:hypothetical protein EVAR_90355_1 [Eumeta japonica]
MKFHPLPVFNDFKCPRSNLIDDLSEGRPSSVEDNVSAVRLMIETGKRVTYHQIRTSLGSGISHHQQGGRLCCARTTGRQMLAALVSTGFRCEFSHYPRSRSGGRRLRGAASAGDGRWPEIFPPVHSSIVTYLYGRRALGIAGFKRASPRRDRYTRWIYKFSYFYTYTLFVCVRKFSSTEYPDMLTRAIRRVLQLKPVWVLCEPAVSRKDLDHEIEGLDLNPSMLGGREMGVVSDRCHSATTTSGSMAQHAPGDT